MPVAFPIAAYPIATRQLDPRHLAAAPPPALADDLTERERDILALLATGLNNGGIALAIGLSRNTVETHLKRVYAKLHAHSRMEAVYRARLSGLLA